MKIVEIGERNARLIQNLLEVWESSVRATHLFLSNDEIDNIRQYVPQALKGVPHLAVAENETGDLIGFMGISGQMLEMLFVSAQERGKGVGKQLLTYGMEHYAVRELAVNEQNPQAKGFYEHMGFQVYKRTDLDEQGNPYPLLYMKYPAVEVRKMNIDDYNDVYRLWMSCSGMGLNNLDDSRDGIAKFLNCNPDTCFVAVYEGRQIVGVILAGNDGRRGYIYHTAVHPDFRKQGIARELVHRAVDALECCGIHKAALVVFKRNTDGNQFWEKMGFTMREDLVYRNKQITELVRIDT